ncbi:uncharacterized protein LOC132054319 [Lycium ferocissimum]|uniref:uncharacterized protein LOC132054319 n=1 Tax=Lycium ferocissimum TaxID=112874 RepID=UPI0028159F38|nr:uncharacterized protein LOC132054319 [Lycium ferocissimum]
MSGFAKYLKELLIKKRLIKHDTVCLTHRVSSIISTTSVQKKEDPGAFTIPCSVGHHDFARALCDNRASISLMSLAIYKQSRLGIPRPTTMRLQMADRSIKRPVGVVDDVLVRVGEFLLPADFIILDCSVDRDIPIILGRPFLATGRALMDSEKNEIKFRVNDEEVTFQASKGMKLSSAYESILVIDAIDVIDEAIEFKIEEECLGEALASILVNLDCNDMEGYVETVNSLVGLGSYSYQPKKQDLDLENRKTPPAKPSIIEPPKLELKQFPSHLRYEFLGPDNTLPVIVSALLNNEQMKKLLEIMREYRRAIGWTIADIRGIPAVVCEHKIQLEKDRTPSVEHRWRLNPPMQEVVKKEIIKWLDVGVVYPIADSKWRCEDPNLVLKWEKCHFMVKEGIVLDHKISKKGIEVDQAKIDVIAKLPPPISAFDELKERLTFDPIIVSPDWSLPFELMCDASGFVVGAVFGQRNNKIVHPIYYASKILNAAQMNYTITEQELLAIVFAFEKFRAYLLGSKVVVYTDHATLRYLMVKKNAKPRLI